MVTLTIRELPVPVVPFRRVDPWLYFRRWKERLQKAGLLRFGWAWVAEYQDRGMIHWHVLMTEQSVNQYETSIVTEPCRRRNKRTGKCTIVSLVRGCVERLCVDSWLAAVGDVAPEFERFQRGGIVERLESPDSVGRYFGAYLSKRRQKVLPDGEAGRHRWWYVSPDQKPVSIGSGFLAGWPIERARWALVYDRRMIEVAESAHHTVPERLTRQRDSVTTRDASWNHGNKTSYNTRNINSCDVAKANPNGPFRAVTACLKAGNPGCQPMHLTV